MALGCALAGCSAVNEGNGSTQQPPGAAAAAGAGSSDTRRGDSGTTGASSSLPQYPYQPGSASPDGRYHGKVRIEGSCVYVENEVERVLPIWPQGQVRWSRPGERFLFQGRDYVDGSDIVVNGGEGRLPPGVAPDPEVFAVAPAPDCDTRIIWFVAPV